MLEFSGDYSRVSGALFSVDENAIIRWVHPRAFEEFSNLRVGSNVTEIIVEPWGEVGVQRLTLRGGSPEQLLVSIVSLKIKSTIFLVQRLGTAADKSVSRQISQFEKVIRDQKFALDQSAIVAITDEKGQIIYVNSKFEEISQFTQHELIGQDHRILNSGQHDKAFFKNLWKTIRSGQVWNGEIRNRAKDGSFYWVDTTIVPFLDEGKKPYQYVAIRFDITAKKRTLNELDTERARALHSEKMASLGVMSAGIAHELGNPLGALRGRIEMLQDSLGQGSPVNEELVLKTCETSLALADRINKIIRALRAYSRDGSGDPFVKVNLSELVDDIFELVQAKCDKKEINLTKIAPKSEIYVLGRETELGQVLVNLLNNSMDAVAELDNRWIEVKLESCKNLLTKITVSDSGHGIAKDLVSKVLDPFFTTKPVGQGTGLGLSITNNIIKSHGGRLLIDGESQNTSFVIELPTEEGMQL